MPPRKHKIIVISGGTRGIGRAIAQRFASEQYHIVTCARSAKDLQEMKATLQSTYPAIEVHPFPCDLSDATQAKAFAECCQKYAAKKGGAIDVLVNNAGTFVPGAIHTEAEDTLEHMLQTNLYSAYHLSRGIIPIMKQTKTGDIFNISSIAGRQAYPNGGSYSISKFALHGMSQGLREELKPHGIRVTTLSPGATYTSSWAGTDLPEGRLIKPEDIASTLWAIHQLSPQTVVEDVVIRPQLGDL